jgi:CubicO group peptidase (beta-lactamase class C family)
MKRIPVLWAIVLVLLACAAPAISAETARAWQEMVAASDAQMTAEGIVGSGLVISKDGRITKEHYRGLADVDSGRKVDRDTIYHWASITKMFTAIAILQLRDRGRLSLDDRIVDYLPETRSIRNPFGPMSDITLRHLMTHSSGLRSATFPWRGDKDWPPHEPRDWSQVAAMMPYSEIEFAPGTRFGYSNLGTSMLGRVVEEITGDDIEVYIAKNILMPLGMSQTYFDTTPYFLLPHRSVNYVISDGVRRSNGLEVETGATSGNGGLNGPLADLLKFAHFLLGVGDEARHAAVLRRETLLEMRQPVFQAYDTRVPGQQMGMSTFTIDQPLPDGRRLRFVGHTGGQMGFASFLYIQQESGLAAVFSMNTRNLDAPRDTESFTALRSALFSRWIPLMTR